MKTAHRENRWYWSSLFPALGIGQLQAAPIEGEFGSNAAALLMLLGVWALFMGVRNLRELRHKRLVPNRQFHAGTDQLENPGPKGHN